LEKLRKKAILFTFACIKEVGFGLFLGENVANIILILEKLKVGVSIKNL
jgi:hypothetical protein